jgi:hypothetical protein
MGTGVIAGDSGTCTWTPPGLAASGAAAGAGAAAAGGSSAAIASLRGESIVTPAARTRQRVTLKFVRRGQARGERFMMDRPTPSKDAGLLGTEPERAFRRRLNRPSDQAW